MTGAVKPLLKPALGLARNSFGQVVVREGVFNWKPETAYYRCYRETRCYCLEHPGMICMFCSIGEMVRVFSHTSADLDAPKG